MNFQDYIDAFNSGDDNGLVKRYFTEDFVYEGGARKIEGQEAWRRFLHFAHNGVREIFRLITTFDGPSGHFCEIDMDFHAIAPRPDFPFGPLAPGDMYTVKFFVIYEQTGDRFSRLKAATWPVNQGTSNLPRLGSHVTQRAAFEAFKGALIFENGAGAAQYFGQALRSTGVASALRMNLGAGELVEANDLHLIVQTPEGRTRLDLASGMIAALTQI